MVAPGTYQVRLSLGEWSQTQKIQVLIDPNVAKDGITQADLEAQQRLSLDILSLRERAQKLSEQLETLRRKLDQGTDQTGLRAQVRTALSEIRNALVTAPGRYPMPMLLDQIGYLSSMLDRADQRPGNEAYQRYEELLRWTSDLEERLKTTIDGASSLKLALESRE